MKWPGSKADTLAWQVTAAGLPAPQREYRFSPPRRWRFDLAWPEALVACEVDGAVFTHGRHTRGAGYEKDCEKLNTAAVLGWRVLRVTPTHVTSGEALAWIEHCLPRADTSDQASRSRSALPVYRDNFRP